MDNPARAFDEVPGSYGVTIYQKTAGLMLTLRNLIGEEAFDEVFREYGRRARFRHPTGEDLEGLFVEMLGPRVPVATEAVGEPVELDFEAYFEQALRTVRRVDFAVGSVIHTRKIGTEGWRRDESGELVGGEEPPDYLDFEIDEMETSGVLSIVRVERVGHFHIPVELEVEFEDGSRELRIWHGNDPYGNFEWEGRRVVRAFLDPDNKLLLERRRLDNMRRYRPDDGDSPDDGLSDPFGDLVEAVGLVLLGGLMP